MGQPTISFAPLNVSQQAINSEPALSNFASFDVMASVAQGDELVRVGVRLILPHGPFYNHPFGSNGHYQPSLEPAFPAIAYDTFVTNGVNFDFPDVTAFVGSGSGSIGVGNVFDARWGRPIPVPGPGNFRMARITFPNASIGVIAETAIFTTAHPQGITASIAVVPEPAVAALTAGLLAGEVARRRVGARRF